MAQVVNDEGHNRKDRNLAPRNVSIWRQDQEAATSFRCRTCHRQFTSQEIATLHSQMEHPSVFASHCDTQSLIESLVESVRSPGSRCIYKRTAALVANDISDLLKRNERMDIVRSTYDSLLELERLCRSASSRVALLTKTIPQRARLVELSPELPCRRGPLWEALEIDDHSILTILQLAVSCDKDEIMGLRENSAASFLTLADSVLYPDEHGHYFGLSHSPAPALETDSVGFRYNLRRINVRLSMASYQLPEGLYLTGVTSMDREQVAVGGYADVRKGQYCGRLVALKTMRVFSRQKPDELSKIRKTFCREISLLHGLDHRNICGLIGTDRELFGGQLCLVTEWMSHGSIMDFIETKSFDLGEVKQFVMGIALALEYLHGKNVVHGDLHVRNILIDASCEVRLIDFGLSDFSDASSASVSSAAPGATLYMAPEILDPEKYGLQHVRHTPKSDIHSFAMCVWTIFDRKTPFHGYSKARAIKAIIEGERPLQNTVRHPVPPPLWSLLELCWQEQPRDRPSSLDLYLRLRRMFQPPASAPLRSRSRIKGLSSGRSGLASRLREDNSNNESTSGSSNGSDDGGLTPQPTLRLNCGMQSARNTRVAKSKLMITRISSPIQRPRNPAPERSSTPPVTTVRNLASVHTGAERLVPQIIYRPPQTQQLAGANTSPIMFNVWGPSGCGISCLDALNEQFSELQDSNDIIECPRCMVLRIMWPDYEPWSVLIILHSDTTRADLATRVSSYTQTFLDESLAKCLNPNTRWKLGPGAITLSDLELVGLQPVAVRDWQVHFRVCQAAPLAK